MLVFRWRQTPRSTSPVVVLFPVITAVVIVARCFPIATLIVVVVPVGHPVLDEVRRAADAIVYRSPIDLCTFMESQCCDYSSEKIHIYAITIDDTCLCGIQSQAGMCLRRREKKSTQASSSMQTDITYYRPVIIN